MADPLPARVRAYVRENPDATPEEVLDAADLADDETCHEQVEHYLAVTRFGIFGVTGENDTEGLRFNTVEWSDVADWDV